MTVQEVLAQSTANQAVGGLSSAYMQHVEMHNFCPKCGLKREAAWKFCPTDGKSLTDHPAYGLQGNWQAQSSLAAQGGFIDGKNRA